MINPPAVIVVEYGDGRVLCISPHPESTDALNRLVQNAVRWTARRRRIASKSVKIASHDHGHEADRHEAFPLAPIGSVGDQHSLLTPPTDCHEPSHAGL